MTVALVIWIFGMIVYFAIMLIMGASDEPIFYNYEDDTYGEVLGFTIYLAKNLGIMVTWPVSIPYLWFSAAYEDYKVYKEKQINDQ